MSEMKCSLTIPQPSLSPTAHFVLARHACWVALTRGLDLRSCGSSEHHSHRGVPEGGDAEMADYLFTTGEHKSGQVGDRILRKKQRSKYWLRFYLKFGLTEGGGPDTYQWRSSASCRAMEIANKFIDPSVGSA